MDNPATIRPGSSGNRALASRNLDKAELTKTIIQQYLDGKPIKKQAIELGVAQQRLYQILWTEDADGWASAQAAKAWLEYEGAKDGLDRARDKLELARAREKASNARFELSTLCRRLFGQDQPVQQAAVSISIHIGSGSVSQTAQDAAQEVGNGPQVYDAER